jgi:hypothetical protein
MTQLDCAPEFRYVWSISKSHGTKASSYCVPCGGVCEFGPQTPQPPRQVLIERGGPAISGLVGRSMSTR